MYFYLKICSKQDRCMLRGKGSGQVLVNLISNALKYSLHTKDIIVDTRLNNNEVIVSVQDFGIGISNEKQQKVFE